MSKKYLTVEELAQRMRVSMHTIRCRLSTGQPMPPSIQVGRRRLFPEDVFDEWMCKQIKENDLLNEKA